MVPEGGRGTGRTTRQMKSAPKGAIYIWCNEVVSYARDLALRLGRPDLVIRAPSALDNGGYELRGGRAIVVDHAALDEGDTLTKKRLLTLRLLEGGLGR